MTKRLLDVITRDVLFEYNQAVVTNTGWIPILAVFQNLRWNSNKTSLVHV